MITGGSTLSLSLVSILSELGRQAKIIDRIGKTVYVLIMKLKQNTHDILIGYLFWLFGFMGAHRFYYGRPVSGTLWFFTFGLMGIGWLVDLFLIPSMDREADIEYVEGHVDYNLCWILLTFLGVFGIHRFYMGKIGTGIIYFLTAGLAGIGILHDFWTLNTQISESNLSDRQRAGHFV